ncbi:hypothetical protein [Kamptonema sp. UHCC 0994]|uniref:hypothetical protein n=1 Tax=Kamptonema sp. UHCC 0994 TaxID=3031329 RepID=UPI0023B8977E|nr:hypothetical protein [Kamptonema sp. UHCC 0994]MDF0555235.1 hypothetical protein [Kamptonema sp. UHCC 0994]
MNISRSVFWVNCLAFVLVIVVTAYAKFFTYSVGSIFHPPDYAPFFTFSLLTNLFQLLCSIPVVLCAFSWALLRNKHRNKKNTFIFASAILTGAFVLVEFFRVHVHLEDIGIPKLVTVVFFVTIAIGYGLAFWRVILSTPYFLLITSMGLMFIVVIVDSLKLPGDGIPSLLEGVPKLFTAINIVLYYWVVCFREVKRMMINSVDS